MKRIISLMSALMITCSLSGCFWYEHEHGYDRGDDGYYRDGGYYDRDGVYRGPAREGGHERDRDRDRGGAYDRDRDRDDRH